MTNVDSTNKFFKWILEHKGDVNSPVALSALLKDFSQKENAIMVNVHTLRKRFKRALDNLETMSQTYTINQMIQLHFVMAIVVSEKAREEFEKHGKLQIRPDKKTIRTYHSYDGTFIRTGNNWDDTQSSRNSSLTSSSTTSARTSEEEQKQDLPFTTLENRPPKMESSADMPRQSCSSGSMQGSGLFSLRHASSGNSEERSIKVEPKQNMLLSSQWVAQNSRPPKMESSAEMPRQSSSSGSMQGSGLFSLRHASSGNSEERSIKVEPKQNMLLSSQWVAQNSRPPKMESSADMPRQSCSSGSMQGSGLFSLRHAFSGNSEERTIKVEPKQNMLLSSQSVAQNSRPPKLEISTEMAHQRHQNGLPQRREPVGTVHESARRDMFTLKQEEENFEEYNRMSHQEQNRFRPGQESACGGIINTQKEEPVNLMGSIQMPIHNNHNGSFQRRSVFPIDHSHRAMLTPKEESQNSELTTQMAHQNQSTSSFQQGHLLPGQDSEYDNMAYVPNEEPGSSVESRQMFNQNRPASFLQGFSPISQGLLFSLQIINSLQNLILVLNNSSLDPINEQIDMEKNNRNRLNCVIRTEDFMESVRRSLVVLRGGAYMNNPTNRLVMQYDLFLNLFKFFLLSIGAPTNDPAVIEVENEIENCKRAPSMVIIEVSKVSCVLSTLFHTATPAV